MLKITTMGAANDFLRNEFQEQFNARFMHSAEEEGSGFVACKKDTLKNILCVQHERRVGNDNTVRYNRRIFQLFPKFTTSNAQRNRLGAFMVRSLM